jgi:hypothetical protein
LLLPLLCSPVARADGGTTPTVASSPSSAVAAAAAVGDLASSNGGDAVPPAVAPTAPLGRSAVQLDQSLFGFYPWPFMCSCRVT